MARHGTPRTRAGLRAEVVRLRAELAAQQVAARTARDELVVAGAAHAALADRLEAAEARAAGPARLRPGPGPDPWAGAAPVPRPDRTGEVVTLAGQVRDLQDRLDAATGLVDHVVRVLAEAPRAAGPADDHRADDRRRRLLLAALTGAGAAGAHQAPGPSAGSAPAGAVPGSPGARTPAEWPWAQRSTSPTT